MRFPDVSDFRFLGRTIIIALAVYLCLSGLIDGQEWHIGPGACMFDNKYYSVGSILEMGFGARQCMSDPDNAEASAIWTDLP